MNKKYDELQKLYQSNQDDLVILKGVLKELTHRKTPKAKSLLEKVRTRFEVLSKRKKVDSASTRQKILPGIDVEAKRADLKNSTHRQSSKLDEETPDDQMRPKKLTLMRAPGVKGLPQPYSPSLNNDLVLGVKDNADLPDLFIAALGELIKEIKKDGSGQKFYELEKGYLIDTLRGNYLYNFGFTDDAELFEDAQIEIRFQGRRVSGSIVSINAGRIVLTLREDAGKSIGSAQLVVDATALLVALKEKIESVGKKEISLNRQMADAVAGRATWPSVDNVIPHDDIHSLNHSQKRAYRHALTNALTFIWGPPGCGKTKTLGEIVKTAFANNKRVLVCSNTNKAVDQVIYHICKAFGQSHPAMAEGKVLRLGRIADDKLNSEFSSYVSLDGIVERLSRELIIKKELLENNIENLDNSVLIHKQTVVKFDNLAQAEKQLNFEKENVNKLAKSGKAKINEYTLGREKLDALNEELESSKKSYFKFLKRKENSIVADINSQRNRIERIMIENDEVKLRYAAAYKIYEEASGRLSDCISDVSGLNLQYSQQELNKYISDRAVLVDEMTEIDNSLSAVRDIVLREARIVGTTCTKSYLSYKNIGQVDMVIIDEASMVTLPVVWFTSGLSRERVVISGDFRQIPPIVPTRQQAIFDVISPDAFTANGLTNLKDSRLLLLDTQYRMRSDICNLISKRMYDSKLLTYSDRAPVPGEAPPELFNSPLTIVDTSDLWPFETQNAFSSRFNLLHALLVRNIVWHFSEHNVVKCINDFGVCTPYAAQSRIIHKILEGDKLNEYVYSGTVHRYQGDERRVMLLEIPESYGGAWYLGQFVQGVPPDSVGARLINVAISRAQDYLIIIANLTYLDKHLPSTSLLRDVLYNMQNDGRVISGCEVMKLRPIEQDLSGLIGQMDFDDVVKTLGVFDERQFELALAHDIKSATQYIVLFSGYITPARVAKIAELLRFKINSGVKIRCITRPPKLNGSISESASLEAIEMLEGIGAVVDCRAKIHQKVCLIDEDIIWWGSLNCLSHMYHSDETMTRAKNREFSKIVAAHMSKRNISVEKSSAQIAEQENPRCPRCGKRTVYSDGKFGPYFYCDSQDACDWKQSIRKRN